MQELATKLKEILDNTSQEEFDKDWAEIEDMSFKGIDLRWVLIGEGSEAKVYSDGEFAYRVVKTDIVDFERYSDLMKDHIGKDYKNVGKVYEMWYDGGEMFVKMELLEKIKEPESFDPHIDFIHEEVCMGADEIKNLPPIISQIRPDYPELKRMVQAIYDAGKQLGWEVLDMGFHNLMYDPKTNEYKQIDLF